MLTIRNIDVFYGPVQALHHVSMEVNQQEIVSIIGANGAGKSSLMKSIMGIAPAQNGEITFLGKRIDKLPTHRIVRLGIAQVQEGRRILAKMTVEENLQMGAYSLKISKAQLENALEEQYNIFPRLKERRKQLAGTLSGGEQQMLAISRGLMMRPKLWLLDEPSMGLALIVVDEVVEIIKRVNQKQNIPILLVEQNAFMALSVSQRSYVLENGVITLSGNSQELLESEEIKKSYLGG